MKRKRSGNAGEPGPTRRKEGNLNLLNDIDKVKLFIDELEIFLSSEKNILKKRILVTILYEIEFGSTKDDDGLLLTIPYDKIQERKNLTIPFEKIQDEIYDVFPQGDYATYYEDLVVEDIRNFFNLTHTLQYDIGNKYLVNYSIFQKAPTMHFWYRMILKKLNDEFGFKNPDSKYSILEEYAQRVVDVLKRENEEYIRKMRSRVKEGEEPQLFRRNYMRVKYYEDNFQEFLVDDERKVIQVGEFGEYAIVIGYFSDREVFIKSERLVPVRYKLTKMDKYFKADYGDRAEAFGGLSSSDFKDPEMHLDKKRELLFLIVKKTEFLNQLSIEKRTMEGFLLNLRRGLGVRTLSNFLSMSVVMFSSKKDDDALYASVDHYLSKYFSIELPNDKKNDQPSISPLGRVQFSLPDRMTDEEEEEGEKRPPNQPVIHDESLKLFRDQDFFRSYFSNEVNHLHTISKEEIRGIVDYVCTWRRIPKFECFRTLEPQEKRFIILCLAPVIEEFLYYLPNEVKEIVKEKKKKKRISRPELYKDSILRQYHFQFFTRNAINIMHTYAFISVLLGRDPVQVERWVVTEIFSLGLYTWDEIKYDSTHRVVLQKNRETFLQTYQRVWMYNHQNMSFQHCDIAKKSYGRLSTFSPRYYLPVEKRNQFPISSNEELERIEELELGYYYRIDDLSKGREYFPVVLENTKDFIPYLQIRYMTRLGREQVDEQDVESVCGTVNDRYEERFGCQCLKMLSRSCTSEYRMVYYTNNGFLIDRKKGSTARSYRSPHKKRKRRGRMVDEEEEEEEEEGRRGPDFLVIHECGKFCACSKNNKKCKNKITQTKPELNLVIRKHNVKCAGWCVVSCSKIKAGSFLAEYVGEVISDKIANFRGEFYDAEGLSYLFDMIPPYINFEQEISNEDNIVHSLDAYESGNFTRYFNHSCDPNLITRNFTVGNQTNLMCRVAFFTLRDIEPGEHLTFDYNYEINKDHSKRMRCYCGSKNCRKWFR